MVLFFAPLTYAQAEPVNCNTECNADGIAIDVANLTAECASDPDTCSSNNVSIAAMQDHLTKCAASCAAGNSVTTGFKGSAGILDSVSNSYGVSNPKTLPQIIGGIISVALSLLGVIFLVLTIYGGYIWMIARGEEKEADRAKNIVTRATIGFILVLAAYAISYFVFTKLISASGILK